MQRSGEPRGRTARAELQAWYVESLRPKLTRAASEGIVTPAAARALDRQLRDLLEVPARAAEEAA